jgi:hypothetical protein
MTTTKQDQQGNTVIIKDGNQLICPYQQPLALPGQLAGQIQIMRLPCSSLCPMFNLTPGKITLKCTNTVIETGLNSVP